MQSMVWICYFYLVWYAQAIFIISPSFLWLMRLFPSCYSMFLSHFIIIIVDMLLFCLRFFPFPVIVLVTMALFFFALSCPFRFAFCHHSVAPTVLFILTTSNLYNIAWRQRAKITPPTTISCRHHHKLNDNFLILNFMFIFTFWCFSVHISDVFFSLSARSLLVRCMISWQRLIGRRTHKKRNSTKRWIMKTVVFRLLRFAVTNSILHKITHFSDHNNLIIILQNRMEAIPYYIARITVALIYTSRLISPSGYFAAHT